MKTKVTTFICAISISTLSISQDIITFKNGDEKKAKVIEISPTEVKYKSFDNIEGPVYTDQKSAIFMIKYENGLKDVFNESSNEINKSVIQKPADKEIPNRNYLESSNVNGYINDDLIVTIKGDSIKCVIDEVTPTTISYHILKQGIDSRAYILIANVSKYYNNKETKREIVSVVEAPKAENVVPSNANPDEDEFLPEARRYGGPRVGATLVGPGVFRDMLTLEGKRNLYSQFGWQFEKRLFTTKTGISAMVEFVPMIGGIDMGKFIPSVSGLIGIRTKKGIELGAGPNAAIYGYKNEKGYYTTSTNFGIVIAAGMSIKSDKVYFPINLAFIPSVGKTARVVDPSTGKTINKKYETGAKISLLVGFNYRKK